MTDLLLQRLEGDLNRRIADSETASALLMELEGRSLAIQVTGAPFTLYLTAMPGRLAVDRRLDGLPDASLEGSVVAMAQLAGGDARDTLRRGQVRFGGDGEVGERFQALLEAARPEWEEELSRLTGDVAAHHLGQGLRTLQEFGRRGMQRIGREMADYLQQDQGQVASREDVAGFVDAVDRLRDDVARLEARLERLARRARNGSAGAAS
jgi:ubiquinone biosynthesis protein UbiJ